MKKIIHNLYNLSYSRLIAWIRSIQHKFQVSIKKMYLIGDKVRFATIVAVPY